MNLSDIKKATAGKFTSQTGVFMELELSKVYPNPDQPRKMFGTKEIVELADAIKQDGLLQPIVVVRRESNYMIIAGERRYKAHKLMQSPTIKAHIIKVDDAKILELTLIENIQREDLSDFETAKHISKLWESGNYALKKDLATAIAKSSSYISKALGCMKLSDAIIQEIELHKLDIPLSVLGEISRVDEDKQVDVFKKYQGKEITRDDIKEFKRDGISHGKKEKQIFILKDNIYTKHGVESYLVENISKKLKYSKSYKITIEEI